MPNMTLQQFTRHLDRMATNMPTRISQALRHSGVRVQNLAQSYIGEYQTAVRPFPAWRPLAEATIEDRIAKGFAADEPLLRTGELQSSIRHNVIASTMTVYSNNRKAAYQEFGTPNARNPIPPRAFIGRAMAQRGRVEALMVARAAFRPLFTGRP